jgi:ribonuclease Z
MTNSTSVRFTLALTLAVLASTRANAQLLGPGQSAPRVPDTGLHAVLLGTGIPVPNPDRAKAATLIVAGGKTFMVDTGPGSSSRLTENGYRQVDYVLYTHFHLDHYADLDWMLFRRGGANPDHPQAILGPKGTKDIVDKIVESVAIDEKYRLDHHGEQWSEQAMQAAVQEFEPGVIFDEDGLKITMFNVNHEPIVPAVGYRFDYEGKSIVISGDTKKSNSLIAAAQGCDLLIHEAMNVTVLNPALPALKKRRPRTGAVVDDMMSHHTPTLEVAEVARATNAKKLVLTHLVPSIVPEDDQEEAFVRGMSDIYSGPIVVGRDNMVFTVE